jgi:Na+/H+ antiporter NhaD/arsenite permease-like protein
LWKASLFAIIGAVLLPVAVFVIALAALVIDRPHRTIVALAGAVVVVATGVVSQELAIESIDFNTLGLLVGMMLIVRITEPTGVYNYLAIRAGQAAGGSPLRLVFALAVSTALISAFLDNLTTILVMVPITFVLADALDLDPIPLVILEIISSNVGGTATLIGDPPNILIAGATGLTFGDFLVNLAPVAIVTLVAVTGLVYLIYRKRLRIAPSARGRLMELDAQRSIEDPELLRRSLPILGLTLLGFFLHGPLHLEPATVALAGATLLLVATSEPVDRIFSGVEWPTLFFFVGLFVLVGALEESGAIAKVAEGLRNVSGGDRTTELLTISWGSAIGSAVVDNIPFTAAMIPVVEELKGASSDTAYWWALSLGACFGGNATLIAAAANVAAAGLAEGSGRKIGFTTFLRVGIPATLLSMLLATAYLMIRYI